MFPQRTLLVSAPTLHGVTPRLQHRRGPRAAPPPLHQLVGLAIRVAPPGRPMQGSSAPRRHAMLLEVLSRDWPGIHVIVAPGSLRRSEAAGARRTYDPEETSPLENAFTLCRHRGPASWGEARAARGDAGLPAQQKCGLGGARDRCHRLRGTSAPAAAWRPRSVSLRPFRVGVGAYRSEFGVFHLSRKSGGVKRAAKETSPTEGSSRAAPSSRPSF